MKTSFIVIAVVILLLLGVGGYLVMNRGTLTSNQTPNPAVQNTPMATSNDATNSGTMPTGTASGEMDTKVIVVEGSPFKFAPSAITVKKGDRVKIEFKNITGTHDFVINEYNVQTKILNAGQNETVEFVADKSGTFEYYCSVGNHREMGMKGTLTVQ
jgi:plastocyanin